MAPGLTERVRALVAPRRRLLIGYAVVVAATAGVAAVAAARDVPDRSAALDVSLGLFAALLTALTIVLVLTVDVDSKWPTLGDIVAESLLPGWFLVATSAVAIGAIGVGRWDSIALVLSLWGALLGIGSLAWIVWSASGRGRRRFLTRVLQRRILVVHLAAGPERSGRLGAAVTPAPPLAPFLRAVEVAIDAGDAAALGDRVDEALGASAGIRGWMRSTALNLQLALAERIGRGVLMGRLSSPLTGGQLLARLGEETVAGAGELLGPRPAKDQPQSADRVRRERAAAVYLGQLSRLVAWQAHAAHELICREPEERPALRSVVTAALQVRASVVEAVDPDPPRRVVERGDPWAGGLTDARALLLWQWGWVEFNPSYLGRDLYVLVEVLTGEKFLGSFGWGGGCPLTDALERLREPGSDPRLAPIRQRAAEQLEALGGLRAASLELLASSLATWRSRRWTPVRGLEGNAAYSTERFRLARAARLFTFRRPADRIPSADEAIEALARLTSRAAPGTDLWSAVEAAYGRLPTLFPPLHAPADRPGACVLAVALRVAPLELADVTGSTAARELTSFVEMLPSRLRGAALELAEEIFGPDGDGRGDAARRGAAPGDAPAADDAGAAVSRLVGLLEVLVEDDQGSEVTA